jgi:hypothetical protein
MIDSLMRGFNTTGRTIKRILLHLVVRKCIHRNGLSFLKRELKRVKIDVFDTYRLTGLL